MCVDTINKVDFYLFSVFYTILTSNTNPSKVAAKETSIMTWQYDVDRRWHQCFRKQLDF